MPNVPVAARARDLPIVALVVCGHCKSSSLPVVALAVRGHRKRGDSPVLAHATHANYLPNVALAARAIDLSVISLAARAGGSLVPSCRPHSCSHCQLLNPFLADCHVASCCAPASRHLSSCHFLTCLSSTPPFVRANWFSQTLVSLPAVEPFAG